MPASERSHGNSQAGRRMARADARAELERRTGSDAGPRFAAPTPRDVACARKGCGPHASPIHHTFHDI